MFTVLSNGYDLHGKNLADIFPDVRTTDITDFLKQMLGAQERANGLDRAMAGTVYRDMIALPIVASIAALST